MRGRGRAELLTSPAFALSILALLVNDLAVCLLVVAVVAVTPLVIWQSIPGRGSTRQQPDVSHRVG